MHIIKPKKDISELINVGYRDKLYYDYSVLIIINLDNGKIIQTLVNEAKDIELLN